MPVEKCVLENRTQGNFTIVMNHVSQLYKNKHALGVYVTMLSKPHDWVFYKELLQKECGIGRKKLESLLKDLVEHNLLIIERVRDSHGKFSHSNYIVLDGLSFKYNNLEKEIHTPFSDPRCRKNHDTFSAIRQERTPTKKEKSKTTKTERAALSQKISKPKSKSTPCPNEPEEIHSPIAKELARQKGLDYMRELLRFQAHAKSMGWKRVNWVAAFIKWIIDARSEHKSEKVINKETRSTVQAWGPGHPSWESVYGQKSVN